MFILTGSQNFLLMERVADSLAGRAAVIPFLGLSAGEWADSRSAPTQSDWIDFLWRGSFPGLWDDGDAAPGRDPFRRDERAALRHRVQNGWRTWDLDS